MNLLLIAGLALVIGFVAPKPKFLSGETRRAEASADASKEVEAAVANAKQAEVKKASVVSASVAQIGVANSTAPDSPQKDFIAREVGYVTPMLPSPDSEALLAAERRRLAVMEGKLELANSLYSSAVRDREELIRKAEKAEANFRQALEQRREVDTRLAEAAAEVRARETLIGYMAGVVVLLSVLYFFFRNNAVHLKDLSLLVSSVKRGEDPIQALDRILPLSKQSKIRDFTAL